jgi:hypothetical protein
MGTAQASGFKNFAKKFETGSSYRRPETFPEFEKQ